MALPNPLNPHPFPNHSPHLCPHPPQFQDPAESDPASIRTLDFREDYVTTSRSNPATTMTDATSNHSDQPRQQHGKGEEEQEQLEGSGGGAAKSMDGQAGADASMDGSSRLEIILIGTVSDLWEIQGAALSPAFTAMARGDAPVTLEGQVHQGHGGYDGKGAAGYQSSVMPVVSAELKNRTTSDEAVSAVAAKGGSGVAVRRLVVDRDSRSAAVGITKRSSGILGVATGGTPVMEAMAAVGVGGGVGSNPASPSSRQQRGRGSVQGGSKPVWPDGGAPLMPRPLIQGHVVRHD